MSAKAAESAPATDKPKGKMKTVATLLAGVLLLASGAGGTWFFLKQKGHDTPHEEAAVEEAKPTAPTYMALENMVFNLADPGGDRVAQVGITLELQNDKTAEQIKQLMPKVRSSVLMLVSQRTSEDILQRDGKEKLAGDVLVEVSRVMGYEVDAPRPARVAKAGEDDEQAPAARKKKKGAQSPVLGVLFSSFIVQ